MSRATHGRHDLPGSQQPPCRRTGAALRSAAGRGSHELTIDHYRDEIHAAGVAKQTQRLEWLTGAIFMLTFVLVALEVLPRISGAGH